MKAAGFILFAVYLATSGVVDVVGAGFLRARTRHQVSDEEGGTETVHEETDTESGGAGGGSESSRPLSEARAVEEDPFVKHMTRGRNEDRMKELFKPQEVPTPAQQGKSSCPKKIGFKRKMKANGECKYTPWHKVKRRKTRCRANRPWRCNVANECAATSPCGDGGIQVCRVDGGATQQLCYASTDLRLAEQALKSTGFCGTCFTAADVVIGGQSDGVDKVPGEYIFTFKNKKGKESTKSILKVKGKNKPKDEKIKMDFEHLDAFVAHISDQDAMNMKAWQKFQKIVGNIEPNYVFEQANVQNNPPSWGLDRIDGGIDGKYSFGNDASGVDMYIFDGYVELDSTEFEGRVNDVDCYDFVENKPCTQVDYAATATTCQSSGIGEHGMSVAGIASGSDYGVAKGANLIPGRIFDCAGDATGEGIVAAVNWVIGRHIQGTSSSVVNLSVEYNMNWSTGNTLIANMHNAGIVVVGAAGNKNKDSCTVTPGTAVGGIVAGATGNTDARASFSNYGSCIDFYAPGVGVPSIGFAVDGGVSVMSGTSQAAPFVAGVAAQILQSGLDQTPPMHYTPDQVKSFMEGTALSNAVSGETAPLLQTLPLATPAPTQSPTNAPTLNPTMVPTPARCLICAA